MSVIKRSWLLGVGIICVLLFSFTFFRIKSVVKVCIDQLMAEEKCWRYLDTLEGVVKKIEGTIQNETLEEVLHLIEMGREIRPFREYLVGEGWKTSYLVLL